MRFYTMDDCRRKANQEWEQAGLARQDGDKVAEKQHTEKARVWDRRAHEGGWEEK